jgi:hypothetical protein
MPVQIRPARVGDGDGMARVWLTAGAYYADLDPAHRPGTVGPGKRHRAAGGGRVMGRDHGAVVARLHTYPGSPVAVPFYERHMGYQRRSILFQKPLS